MTISFYIKLYLVTMAAFLVIDMTWLGLIARNFYRKYLGYVMSPSPNWLAAFLFYLLFIAGLLVFAVVPGIQGESMGKAVLLGALFGLFTYGTYDLTNLATVKNWPVIITIVDMIWGVTLAASVSLISFLAGGWLK